MTQCEKDLALSSTCLTVPQRRRKFFVTIHVALQQHEETSCVLEKVVIPLGKEEKEDNLILKSKEGACTYEKWKDGLIPDIDNACQSVTLTFVNINS